MIPRDFIIIITITVVNIFKRKLTKIAAVCNTCVCVSWLFSLRVAV